MNRTHTTYPKFRIYIIWKHFKDRTFEGVVFPFRHCKLNKNNWTKILTQSSVTTFATLRYNYYYVTLQLALQVIKKRLRNYFLSPY